VHDAPKIDGEASLVVRPEAMFLEKEAGIPVSVVSRVYLGSAMEYRVKLPNGDEVTVYQSNPIWPKCSKPARGFPQTGFPCSASAAQLGNPEEKGPVVGSALFLCL
jgi:hypothetical protein